MSIVMNSVTLIIILYGILLYLKFSKWGVSFLSVKAQKSSGLTWLSLKTSHFLTHPLVLSHLFWKLSIFANCQLPISNYKIPMANCQWPIIIKHLNLPSPFSYKLDSTDIQSCWWILSIKLLKRLSQSYWYLSPTISGPWEV